MTTKTELAPLNIGVRDNQLLVDENGDKFVDLLQDLGLDYPMQGRFTSKY